MVDEVVADEFACPVVITPGVCSAEIAEVRVERYEAAVKGMTCAHCVKAVAAVGRVMGQQVVENRRRRRVPGDGAGIAAHGSSSSICTVSRSVPIARTIAALTGWPIAFSRAWGSSSGRTSARPVRHRWPTFTRTCGSARRFLT